MEGFDATKVQGEYLFSRSSKAPYVYVDAAGGAKAKGKYIITGLSLLERAA